MKTYTGITAAIRRIAKEQLGIDTLKTRNSDGLDFHEVAVWNIQAALEAAYKAGHEAGQAAGRKEAWTEATQNQEKEAI